MEEGALTLLAVESCAIHRLAHGPQHESNGILDLDIILVLLLEQALCRAVVCANAGRLPARVIA